MRRSDAACAVTRWQHFSDISPRDWHIGQFIASIYQSVHFRKITFVQTRFETRSLGLFKLVAPIQKSATICRRKQHLSQKSATLAEFGDSRTFLRQCGQGFSVLCECVVLAF